MSSAQPTAATSWIVYARSQSDGSTRFTCCLLSKEGLHAIAEYSTQSSVSTLRVRVNGYGHVLLGSPKDPTRLHSAWSDAHHFSPGARSGQKIGTPECSVLLGPRRDAALVRSSTQTQHVAFAPTGLNETRLPVHMSDRSLSYLEHYACALEDRVFVIPATSDFVGLEIAINGSGDSHGLREFRLDREIGKHFPVKGYGLLHLQMTLSETAPILLVQSSTEDNFDSDWDVKQFAPTPGDFQSRPFTLWHGGNDYLGTVGRSVFVYEPRAWDTPAAPNETSICSVRQLCSTVWTGTKAARWGSMGTLLPEGSTRQQRYAAQRGEDVELTARFDRSSATVYRLPSLSVLSRGSSPSLGGSIFVTDGWDTSATHLSEHAEFGVPVSAWPCTDADRIQS